MMPSVILTDCSVTSGRHERERARGDGEAAPVAAALGIDSEAEHRLFEHDFVGFDDALEQRGDRQAHGEAVGAEERLAGGAARVGDAQLLEAHVGRGKQAHVDVAADAHVAAEDARRLLFEDAAVAVPVDEMGDGEQRREGERD